MKRNYRIIIACLSIVSLSLILIGTSMSIFSYTKIGTQENSVSTGVLELNFQDGINNTVISLNNSYPISDEIGKSYVDSNQVFDFTITGKNTSDDDIEFEVLLNKVNTSNLDEDAIKVYLTDITEGSEVEVFEPITYNLLNGNVLLSDVVSSKGSYYKTYRLRMWINKDKIYTPENFNNKTFESVVSINTK